MMISVRIPRRSCKCHSCSRLFCPGTEYLSVLSEEKEKKEGEYGRNDYCCSCWESQNLKEAMVTYWKARVPQRKTIAEDPEGHYLEVLDSLREEIDQGTMEADQIAFLLALYLVRKKKIVFRQEFEREGAVYQVYENILTEEMFSVKKQILEAGRVSAIQQELIERFSNQISV